MTEAQWLVSTDPVPMLDHLGDRLSDRKTRLFACAWASLLWGNVADEGREAVVTAERFADGLSSGAELSSAYRSAHAVCSTVPRYSLWRPAIQLARDAADPTLNRKTLARPNPSKWNTRSLLRLADVLRDLFGPLPFRPVHVDPAWLSCNGGAVAALAKEISEGPAFDYAPILADALEDAGCGDADLLSHLRSPILHVRGCWALDLILGRQWR
jgi:hypothetical protein